MNYLVIDTERIKGYKIYLLAYQVYNELFELLESKTYQDLSIDLSTRKAPKSKAKALNGVSFKVNSFNELYDVLKPILFNKRIIVFSSTDFGAFKTNCKELGIEYEKVEAIDLQKALYDLSTSPIHKSNLKDYAKKLRIKHNPHIPASDCEATMELYIDLLNRHGEDFIKKYLFRM